MTTITICNACGFERPAPEQQSPGPVAPPGEGDFWLCPKCGEVHRWCRRGEAELRATGVDVAEVAELPREDAHRLLAFRRLIRLKSIIDSAMGAAILEPQRRRPS